MKTEEYEAIVKDCKNSGMTIREYGEQKRIPVETLHTWIRRPRKRKGIRDDRKVYEEYRTIVIECKSSGKTAKEWSENEFQEWLRQIPTAEARKAAEKEILSLFSAEPDEQHQWTKQDICEQVRKILRR